jgi:hypothetical protein
MDYKWYDLYSYWVIVLVLLYKLDIIKINLLPSVLYSLIGSFVVIYLKHKNNIKMSFSYIIYMLVVHSFSLFLVPRNFDLNDLIYNIMILIFYNVFIFQSKGISSVALYKKDILSNSDKTIYNILKDRDII